MKLNLITKETVKTYIGIASGDTSQDALIDAYIPIISADVRKILNTQYSQCLLINYTAGTNEFIYYPDYSNRGYYHSDNLEVGTVLEDDSIDPDSYIIAYDCNTGIYIISNNFLANGTTMTPTINIRQWNAISKMVWYKLSSSTQSDATKSKIKSKSYGGISLSYADSEINSKYNYPQTLIDDLGTSYISIS